MPCATTGMVTQTYDACDGSNGEQRNNGSCTLSEEQLVAARRKQPYLAHRVTHRPEGDEENVSRFRNLDFEGGNGSFLEGQVNANVVRLRHVHLPLMLKLDCRVLAFLTHPLPLVVIRVLPESLVRLKVYNPRRGTSIGKLPLEKVLLLARQLRSILDDGEKALGPLLLASSKGKKLKQCTKGLCMASEGETHGEREEFVQHESEH